MKEPRMPEPLVLIVPAGAIDDIEFSVGSCCGPVRGDGVSLRSDNGRGGGVLSQAQVRELHKWLGKVIDALDAGWKPNLPDFLKGKVTHVYPSAGRSRPSDPPPSNQTGAEKP